MFKDDMSIIKYKYFLDAFQGNDEHLNEAQKRPLRTQRCQIVFGEQIIVVKSSRLEFFVDGSGLRKIV